MRVAPWIVILLVGMVPRVQAANIFWLKAWKVVDAQHIPTEDGTFFLAAIGKSIVLSKGRFLNPLAESCSSHVDYSDLQYRPVAELGRHFGDNWVWPVIPSQYITYGWIRCNHRKMGAFAFIDTMNGFYFFEDGAVVRLQ